MKNIDTSDCATHVLVCTNERPPEKVCCKKVGGQDFYDRLKKKLKEEGLYDRVWITRTGCLGFCNDVGTTVAIYKKDQPTQWYNEVTESDFNTIWHALSP